MTTLAQKAVILARGLGTRMRAEAPSSGLTSEQQRFADAGLKALIPVVNGRTLLDLITENLRAAGISDLLLVVGPEHDAIRSFCAERGIGVKFLVQDEPLGTADAVLAAKPEIAEGELFIVVNSDNLYPVKSLRRLRETGRPAMLAFERNALISQSNISAERIGSFATVEISESGSLIRIVEKPEHVERDAFVSMNAWSFSSSIFSACQAIERSKRGEFEIADAVQYSIDVLGESFVAVRTDEGVLDLSSRVDISNVARLLEE